MRILIAPDGSIKCLYTEDFDIREIVGQNKLNITRAAHVEFSNELQVWEIVLRDGQKIGEATTRGKAIDMEVKFLESNM